MAALDWLQTYEAALANTYGDKSQDVIDIIKKNAGKEFQDAIDKGFIKEPTIEKTAGSNEGGGFEYNKVTDTGIDWSKLPTMGPAGYKLPKNAMWAPVYTGGTSAGTKESDLYGKAFGFYDDPNYGRLALIQARAPEDKTITLGRAAILSAIGGMALAPAAAAAAGVTSGIGTGLIGSGINMGLNAAVTGKAPTWQQAAISLGGGALGAGLASNFGATGFSADLIKALSRAGVSAAVGQKTDWAGLLASLASSGIFRNLNTQIKGG